MNNDLVQTGNSEIIEQLFPESVAGIILPIDDYQSQLHPDEYKIISSACNKRKFEFSTGRFCAKQALASQGINDTVILVGENREPIWPDDIVGSISHCKDQCGAVIARNSDINSIGLDIENIKILKNDIGRVICTDKEKQWLKNQKQYPYNVLVTLIFSLKEAVYKCIYQHQQVKLGFKDISIIPNLETNTADIHVKKHHVDSDIKLSFSISKKHIHAGAMHY